MLEKLAEAVVAFQSAAGILSDTPEGVAPAVQFEDAAVAGRQQELSQLLDRSSASFLTGAQPAS